MSDLALVVKLGSQEHQCCLSATSTVAQLKAQLEPLTGLMSRQQKLIFKGKVMEDSQSLTSCKLVSGAKLMLLAAQASTTSAAPC
jgi:leucine-rich repeat protein SHOC2